MAVETLSDGLLAFEIENVRSFRDAARLDMGSLRTVGLFGANGAGKSNFLEALIDMRQFVADSFDWDDTDRGSYDHSPSVPRCRPFLPSGQTCPSRYETKVVAGGVVYRYGFEVTEAGVVSEWAYWYPNGRAALLFDRNGDTVKLGRMYRKQGRSTQELLRPKVLFLTAAGRVKRSALTPLYEWFYRSVVTARPARDKFLLAAQAEKLAGDQRTREATAGLMRHAGFGISDVWYEPTLLQRMFDGQACEHVACRPNRACLWGVTVEHENPDGSRFSLPLMETSSGARAWFAWAGVLLNALPAGMTVLVDNLDTDLHPHLVGELLGLFADPRVNTGGVQLLFTSHSPLLLRSDLGGLKPSQIRFVDKDTSGASKMVPMSRGGTRSKADPVVDYLSGRYTTEALVDGQAIARTLASYWEVAERAA